MTAPWRLSPERMENLIEREQKNGLETDDCFKPVVTKLAADQRGTAVVPVKSKAGNDVVSGMLR